MKQFKLKIHPPSYSDELLIFNSSDLPEVNIFDLLKIYHCDSSPTDSVLVQVNSLKHGDLPKDTISVESSLAQSFGLVVFRDVFVLKTEPEMRQSTCLRYRSRTSTSVGVICGE
uniref:IML1 N-terminal double psi beta-barrel domain-containing protein n=1 Tax=Ciona savignyi TaxID=51511 RepID=H2ZF95_CIOSA